MLLNKKHYGIQEVADITGISTSCLRIWEKRYNWPKPVRSDDNNYRKYPTWLVQQLIEFKLAGCPVSQVKDGFWNRPSAGQVATFQYMSEYKGKVKDEFLNAFRLHHTALIAFYLASLGRMHPNERQTYINCAAKANAEHHGLFTNQLRLYVRETYKLCSTSTRNDPGSDHSSGDECSISDVRTRDSA